MIFQFGFENVHVSWQPDWSLDMRGGLCGHSLFEVSDTHPVGEGGRKENPLSLSLSLSHTHTHTHTFCHI